jgi:hypothetical protein
MHQTCRDSDLRLGQFAETAGQIVARFSPDADFSHRLMTRLDQQHMESRSGTAARGMFADVVTIVCGVAERL